MIKVKLVLPDGRKGTAEINPFAPIKDIKNEFLEGFEFEGPTEDYVLAVATKKEHQSPDFKLKDGDIIFIIKE